MIEFLNFLKVLANIQNDVNNNRGSKIQPKNNYYPPLPINGNEKKNKHKMRYNNNSFETK